MNPSLAVQLMIGRAEHRTFGEAGVLAKLAEAEALLDFGTLLLAVADPASALARHIVDRCRAHGRSVALWTMVLADTGRAVCQPSLDAQGRPGHGRLGAWPRLGDGDEAFLFSCPTAAAEEAGIQERIAAALAVSGADAVFLDRIRHPAPSNGLESLGACGCPRCREAFRRETGEPWPDLTALALALAPGGADGAARFLAQAGTALAFRASRITRVVEAYARAARQAGARVGLDLFAPSLAALVGQDYARLGDAADFIKAMLYCKAEAPAGIPLELACLVDGLVAGGVPVPAARAFTAALLGLADEELLAALDHRLPARHAAREYERGLQALPRRAALFAGIELVDHPAYATRIGAAEREAYLDALRGAPLALCWNVLYIPSGHLRAVALARRACGAMPGKEP
jgi:hypothetical protein